MPLLPEDIVTRYWAGLSHVRDAEERSQNRRARRKPGSRISLGLTGGEAVSTLYEFL